MLDRLRNKFVTALKTCKALPKIILVTLEDDIISEIKYEKQGVEDMCAQVVDWLMKEFNKAVDTYKDFLPFKAKKEDWPHFLWIMPVKCNNFPEEEKSLREAFGLALTTTAANYKNTSVLKLLQVWDAKNPNLYMPLMNKLSNEGIAKYWRATDKTVRYCDSKNFKFFKTDEQDPFLGDGNLRQLNISGSSRGACTYRRFHVNNTREDWRHWRPWNRRSGTQRRGGRHLPPP